MKKRQKKKKKEAIRDKMPEMYDVFGYCQKT